MKYFTTLLITICCYTAYAQRAADADHSLLWCISGNGLSQPSFIFGTEHLICTGNYIWKDYMQDCFARCKKLCTEIDLSDASQFAQIRDVSTDKTGKELRSYYAPQDYRVVHQYFLDSLHRDLDTMQHVKPFFLQALVFGKTARCDSMVSYEIRLMQKARDARMKIAGLETVKEQAEIVDSTSPESATKYLLLAAAAEDAAVYENNKLQSIYSNEDVVAMYQLFGSPQERTMVLGNRNKKWIPKIKKMVSAGPVFFAVGAAHLWGDDGVISLLRNEGYSVIPIKKDLITYPCETRSNTVNGKVVTTITYSENKAFKDGRSYTNFSKRSRGNAFAILDKFSPLAGYDVAEYMQSHLQIPQGHTWEMDDMVTVSFDLTNEGKIYNLKIKQGIGSEYDAEALHFVKNMPNWKKGLNASGVIMPVVFRKREVGE